ncbi:Pectin lyase fold/virulence factor [Trinorchestia longiramus]|nr:Pectin lyase fold/virulence factor [Trinorchestia longiramus]
MRVRITMVNCNIPVVPSSALTQLEVESKHSHGRDHENLALEKTRFITLRFLRCTIGEMESHAFYRARLLYFNFSDVTIGSMSQKSIDLDVYEDWIVQDSLLPHLPANAVCLHTEKSVVFSRNLIQELDPHAWAIEAGGQVLFEYNTVKKIRGNAFAKIIPMEDSRSANIVFLNNTVLSGEPNSLVISDLYPRHERKILNNRFDITCECNITVQFQKMLNINPNNSDDMILNSAVLEYSLCAPHIHSRWRVFGFLSSPYTRAATKILPRQEDPHVLIAGGQELSRPSYHLISSKFSIQSSFLYFASEES